MGILITKPFAAMTNDLLKGSKRPQKSPTVVDNNGDKYDSNALKIDILTDNKSIDVNNNSNDFVKDNNSYTNSAFVNEMHLNELNKDKH